MADQTGIEWTDATWNPIRGCSRVSEGCRHCYAEIQAARIIRMDRGRGIPEGEGSYDGLIAKGGQWNGVIKVAEGVMDQPLRWKKPRLIFVNSMSDLFHENVPFDVVDRIFAVMALAHWHTFQILTKRPERMLEYMSSGTRLSTIMESAKGVKGFDHRHVYQRAWPLPNVHLGVSVEDQKTADERIPQLLDTPAAVRWVSAEPLLGAINLSRFMWPVHPRWPARYNSPAEAKADGAVVTYHRQALVSAYARFLNWVVVGGESGHNARPMRPYWVRSLRDQCVDAGVSFLFKQWGEWAPYDRGLSDSRSLATPGSTDERMGKVGKKKAGRLLDGRTWDQYPEVPA